MPAELREVVKSSQHHEHIRLVDSPTMLGKLYDTTRLCIIPHQYGAGAQFKLSEAMTAGVPSVVTRSAAVGCGLIKAAEAISGVTRDAVCIGATAKELAECVLKLHTDPHQWNRLREGSLRFVRETQSDVVWKKALREAGCCAGIWSL